jgi:hypothetical protein
MQRREFGWRDFKESEVLEVVREFNGDKAPGREGFCVAFFHKCWEVLIY